MRKWERFYETLFSRQSDNNIDFHDMVGYLERLGWITENRGTSHRIYKHPLVPAAINIQPRQDGKVKYYQVAQIRRALEQYTGDNRDGWLRGQNLV